MAFACAGYQVHVCQPTDHEQPRSNAHSNCTSIAEISFELRPHLRRENRKMSQPTSATEDAYRSGISDDAIVSHEQQIRRDEVESKPLLGPIEDPANLISEYTDNPVFLPKIGHLCQLYSGIRRTRGDGNCFYRSFIASIGEACVKAGVRHVEPDTQSASTSSTTAPTVAAGAAAAAASPLQSKYDSLLTRVAAASDLLIALGYPDSTVPDFIDQLLGYIRGWGVSCATIDESVIAPLASDMGWWIIYAVRLLCSLEMRSHEDDYLPFVMGTTDCINVEMFCSSQVEGPSMEADQPQAMALARWFGVRLVIAYLDASPGDVCQQITLPDDAPADAINIHVLYRPGHYDMAYPK